MNARETVLSASPYGGFIDRNRNVPADEVVQEALEEVRRSGIGSLKDARIVAYARYAGIGDADPEQLYREAGLETVLRRELSIHAPRSYVEPERIASALDTMTFMDLVRATGDTQIGWSLAVIALAHDTDPIEVAQLTPMTEDGALLLAMIALIYAVPSRRRPTLEARLISSRNTLVHACGAAMAYEAIRKVVRSRSRIDPVLQGLKMASRPQAIAALGYVLENLGRWIEQTTFSKLDAKRATNVWKKLQALGENLIEDPGDLETILLSAGRREMHLLATLARWEFPVDRREEFSQAIKARAERLYWEQFGTRLAERDSRQITEAPHPDLIVAALVNTLSSTGLSVQDFKRAYDGFASDAFSRITRNGAWFADRRRAVVLIVVAAFVAQSRGDERLKAAVREAADHANSQPPLPMPVFQEDPSTMLGYRVPIA
jgi:hypothetical protein